jgi:hypothetical protein
VREIRLLRSRWRGLETESRLGLHGHERGNPGYRSSRQGCESNGVKVPCRQLPGIGRLAYPMHMKVTTCVLLGWKRHGCPADIEPQR